MGRTDQRALPGEIHGSTSDAPRNILVVEDNATNRKLLGVTLEAEGFTVFSAADGIEALVLLEQQKIDAIVSDILMPGMDGFRLCHEVRKNEKFRNLPFIIYTCTYTSPSDRKLALRVGVDKYIRKPVPTKILVEAVREVSARPRVERPTHFPSDSEVMKEYNEALVRKLEQTNADLARAARQREQLVELSARVVAQRSAAELLATVVDAARELTEARLCVSGQGYTNGEFRVGAASRAEAAAFCPPGAVFKVEKGGVYLEVLHGGPSLRLSEAELLRHPAWRGLPEGHAPLRGLLGARLVDAHDEPCGLIMVSDKEGGSDFTAEDEANLRQLASITSLALGHIEAKTAAEAANAAKGRFLANISHELRTPMNAILGMVDLALPKQVDPIATDFLKTARGSADLLLALLNDLLDSAKIEAGKLEIESAPFSLRHILDQTTQVLAVRASEQGISFSCRIPSDVPDAVFGDQVRLRQVLLNLAGNGIKFTQKGEVTVSVRVESQAAEEACLEFAVRDTGIGIPQSDLDRIFRPFAQADASTTRRFGGTGLGLTICSNLVRLMGGRIWVESEPGHGSTFHFTVRMPLAKELPAAPTARGIPASATSTLRILLAEDNPANQKLAAYILRERGHAVDIAGDCEHALCMAQESRHDVILMDVQMPGMDGIEATKIVRAQETGQRRVPIIAMTAHAMKGDRERCLAAGMDGYLSKPIDGHEMIALVESLAVESLAVESLAAGAARSPAAPAIAPAPVFDPELALKRCLSNGQMLRQMIQYFFDDVDGLFPQMYSALQKGDLVEVGYLGHRMKGTVVYLGAEPAEQAALRVERFCTSSDGSPSEAEEAVNALEQECMALKAALSEHPSAAQS